MRLSLFGLLPVLATSGRHIKGSHDSCSIYSSALIMTDRARFIHKTTQMHVTHCRVDVSIRVSRPSWFLLSLCNLTDSALERRRRSMCSPPQTEMWSHDITSPPFKSAASCREQPLRDVVAFGVFSGSSSCRVFN